jgi:hypothetical protein
VNVYETLGADDGTWLDCDLIDEPLGRVRSARRSSAATS